MKKVFLAILFSLISYTSFSQYSNYYSVDVNSSLNANVNVRKDVNVSGTVNVNKNITSIDYGALAQANAIRERNRIDLIKYENEILKRQSIEIANNPLKAYDYGELRYFHIIDKEVRKLLEVKRSWFTYYTLPKNIFQLNGNNALEIINYSEDGITTSIAFTGPVKRKVGLILEDEEDRWPLERIAKNEKKVIGTLVNYSSEDYKQFLHNKETNRINVYGKSGYSSKLILEDDYEIQIVETYMSENWFPDYISYVFVTYKGDKDEIDFEQLEGRRYYLKRLIEKVIASAYTQIGQ